MILGAPQTSIHSVLEDVLDNKIEIYENVHFLITFVTHFCVYMGGTGDIGLIPPPLKEGGIDFFS